jgi:hypothetical protein
MFAEDGPVFLKGGVSFFGIKSPQKISRVVFHFLPIRLGKSRAQNHAKGLGGINEVFWGMSIGIENEEGANIFGKLGNMAIGQAVAFPGRNLQ